MTADERIRRLITTSIEVYEACLLPNGCLVAAPAHLPIYPPQAKSYFYCWPGRDLGFAIAGMETLGYLVREPLLDWIWKRAEGFQHTGLIFEDYHPNGPRRGPEWQPDQAGTLLWALCRAPRDDERERAVVSRLAEGLVTMWDGTNFRQRYRDLWERRFASPRHDSCFPYTLAACAKGLSLAAERLNVNQWHLTAREMRARLEGTWDAKLTYFPRRSGLIGTDERVDGSLLGLAWPFDVVDETARIRSTVDAIRAQLLDERGVRRYLYDGYDSEVEPVGAEIRQGGGSWPLLTFWLAIALAQFGAEEEARAAFDLGVTAADLDGYFPEQVFPPGDRRVGVKPLLWSHMMFVLAADALGLLPPRDA